MRFLSFFTGIGGIDLGLERAGHKCVGQVEIDEFCLKVLAKHWPDVPRWKDIRDLTGEEIPEAELWAGGDPCQANSAANRGKKTTAPPMAAEFLRVITLCRPRIVLRENPSVCRRDAPWPWRRFRDELERIGYAVLPFKLRACCLGLDHQRERLFLLAEIPNANREPKLQADARPDSNRATVQARARPCRLSWTIPPTVPWPLGESDVVRKIDGLSHRVERSRALGNAVVPQVAEYVGRLLNV